MAPSYDLKQQLVAGEWCFYGHGSEQIVTVDLPWEGHLDPFSLVNFNKPCWKFFWRSKESSQVIVGFGSVLQLGQEILSDSPHLKGLRFFGGLAFPGTPAETWDGFTDGYFVLPEVEWSFTGNEHGSIQLRLLSPADEDRDKLIQRFSDLYRSYVTATLSGTETELGRVVKQSHLPDHDGWVKMVKDAIQSIKSGNHQKVVLSRVQDMILENDIDVGLLLKRLSKLQESSYLFSFTTPEGKTFLGRSPERLLSWQNRTVYVEAIAGTRKRSQGESEDFASACELTNSKKDLVEHRFVSDFVEQTLSQFCTSVEQVEKRAAATFEECPAYAIHLQSGHPGRHDAFKPSPSLASHSRCWGLSPRASDGFYPRARAFFQRPFRWSRRLL